MSITADSLQFGLLHLPKDGSKHILLIERNKQWAEEWLINARSITKNLINYRLHARTIRAEGISIPVYVVVAWRRKERGGLSETNHNRTPTTAQSTEEGTQALPGGRVLGTNSRR